MAVNKRLAGVVAIVILTNLATAAITTTIIETRDNGVVAELRAEHAQTMREQAEAVHWATTP
jgi:hypothetical protein